MKRYQVVVADPPWHFKDKLTMSGVKRGAASHYETLSDAMIAEAARNCRERKLNNVSFVKSDDRLSRLEGMFDLIHSTIVFQHIAPRRVEILVRDLLERLGPGGVGALHFTTWLPPGKRILHGLMKALPPVKIAANIYRRRD